MEDRIVVRAPRELWRAISLAVPALLLAGVVCAAQESPAEATRPGGSAVQLVDVPAPALSGNLLGSATVQEAAIYLPPSYGDDSRRRYPTIYLLHGIFDSRETWLRFVDTPGILDRLIGERLIPEVVAVMPTARNQYGGGFYRDSPVAGHWARYIAEDLISFVDGRYKTLASADARAVMGHSMGGYGALHLVMEHPGVFSVAWAMAPCCLSVSDDLGFGNQAWSKAFSLESPQQAQEALASGDFYAVAALGLLSAFSPAPDQPPFYIEFPFDVVRGEVVVRDEVYNAYLDEFPVRRINGAREQLLALKGLALDAGIRDQFRHIPTGAREFSQRLAEERIPHLFEVYDGDHREKIAQRMEDLILPWIGARLESSENPRR